MNPYASSAFDYWAAGWRGILPLPRGEKTPPPDGYTGAGGRWPSYADITAWAEDMPGANIALRLPPDVIGIDVDTYDEKQGLDTITAAMRKWGRLPDTWRSTSRSQSVSGIYLYRIPVGLRWPGQVGPDVEIIQTRHRYMVAPPSLHPTGRVYQWYAPVDTWDGQGIPSPEDLTELPDAWVSGLTAGALAYDVDKMDVDRGDVTLWLMRHGGAPCRVMFRRLESVLSDLATGGSRHDIAVRAVMAFAHLAHEGHQGAPAALADFRRVWASAVTSGAGARTPEAADGEWWRLLSGAIGVVLANGRPADDMGDPCVNPLAGILPAGDVPTGHMATGATLPETSEQGDAGRLDVPQAPPGQNAEGMLPPPWVTGGQTGDGARGLTPGAVLPATGSAVGAASTDDSTWDRHGIAVALEVERLIVRRDARLALAGEEHLKFWREPRGYSLREGLLLPDVPPQWRVVDVMPEGSNVLLTAQYKTGKTTLINELTKAIADGSEFLGQYKIPSTANVALFNYEVGEAQYLRWLRDRGIVNAEAVHVLNLRGFTLPLSVPLVRDYIVRWLSDRGIGVWIVDPFARAFSGAGDENHNADVSPFLEYLDIIKEQSGVSELVMPTHTGRAEMAIGAERSRGATRLDDWADVRWLLTKDDEGNRYFRTTGRDVETEETRLEYDQVTRALTLGSGSRPPKGSRSAGRGDSGAQSSTGEVCDAILELVADDPGVIAGDIRKNLRSYGVATRGNRITECVRLLIQQNRLRVESVRPATGGNPAKHHYVVGKVADFGDE